MELIKPLRLALCLAALSPISIDNQGKLATLTPTDQALNFASAPLKLVTYPNGYNVTNTSKATILRYMLGCASEEAGKVKITYVLPAEQVSLAPGYQRGASTIDNPEESIFQCVTKRKLKLAVVEVYFADGATWKVEHPLRP